MKVESEKFKSEIIENLKFQAGGEKWEGNPLPINVLKVYKKIQHQGWKLIMYNKLLYPIYFRL